MIQTKAITTLDDPETLYREAAAKYLRAAFRSATTAVLRERAEDFLQKRQTMLDLGIDIP